MHEKWTSEELRAYEQAIEKAPKMREREEAERRKKLDDLFERLHGDEGAGMEGA